jgi:hypothetical protein
MLAYIDPGAGSFVLQAIVATLAGVALALKGYWKKLRGMLRPRGPSDPGDGTGARPGDA